MCDDAVSEDPYPLEYVPDRFVTKKIVKTWHNEDDYYNDDEPVEWYNGCN